MRWKKASNLIIAIILSLAFTIVIVLNSIDSMHIYKLRAVSVYGCIYWILSLIILWGLYVYLRRNQELLFFVIIIVGIVLIILETILWGWVGL